MFTEMERRAIVLLALPVAVAAYRLGISESRFKQLSRSVARKFGAADTKGAIVCAVVAGWVLEIMPPPDVREDDEDGLALTAHRHAAVLQAMQVIQ